MGAQGLHDKNGGFTYLILLLWLGVVSMLLSAIAPAWHMQSQRANEAEYIFRGLQYRQAIIRYAAAINVNGCVNLQQLPIRLEDLLEDHRCGLVRHHLRQFYIDPVSKTHFQLVVNPAGGILGVHSRSRKSTIRTLRGVSTYEDWVFSVDAPVTM